MGFTGAYREDADGNPVYDWTILDRIFDTYLHAACGRTRRSASCRRLFRLKPEPYQHRWTPQGPTKRSTPAGPIRRRTMRNGPNWFINGRNTASSGTDAQEVESWYWEVWNEPNIGYWRGTPQDFYRLHDYAIDAVRRALPRAKVGGPDMAGSGGRFTRQFFEHCLRGTNYATGETGTPLDFVSFHAKGAPTTSTATCAWESPIICELSTTDFASWPRSPN